MNMNKDEYYLNIARAVSERSKCIKAQFGAVIVKNDAILSTGYNGPVHGAPHCETCHRIEQESGTSAYDMTCPAVHAEENAIIHAARHGIKIKGAKLYLSGDYPPCQKCARAIINAGIKKVICNHNGIKEYNKEELYKLAR